MAQQPLLAAALALVLAVAGCTRVDAPTEATAGEKLQVYTSVYPLADFAGKIGGEHVEVTLLVPPGVEPHDFEPTAKELAQLSQADVFIYNGAGLEPWIDEARQLLDPEQTMIVNATESVDLLRGSGQEEMRKGQPGDQEHRHMDVDPHVWLDPLRAKKQAETIRDALVKADPDHAQDYRANFDKLSRRFDELDQTFSEIVKNAEKKVFIVAHASFGYLAERYGLKQIAVSGLSPSDEPGPKKLKNVIETAKTHRVNVIFFETLVSGNVARTVKNEVGAEALVLNPLEGLTKEEAEKGEDYFSIMEKNADNLGKALGSKE